MTTPLLIKRCKMLYDFWRVNPQQRQQQFYERFDEINSLIRNTERPANGWFGRTLSKLVNSTSQTNCRDYDTEHIGELLHQYSSLRTPNNTVDVVKMTRSRGGNMPELCIDPKTGKLYIPKNGKPTNRDVTITRDAVEGLGRPTSEELNPVSLTLYT